MKVRLVVQAAEFAQQQLWDESSGRLRRSFCRNPSAVQGFADDYSYLISQFIIIIYVHPPPLTDQVTCLLLLNMPVDTDRLLLFERVILSISGTGTLKVVVCL